MKSESHLVSIIRWRKQILVNMIVVGIVAAIVSLMLPEWFRARASLIPSSDEPVVPGVVRALQDIGGVGAELASHAANPGFYVEILNSYNIAERLVNQFELQDAYGAKNLELTIALLRKRTTVLLNRNGVIEVYVEDRKRQRAADLANAYVEALDFYNQESRTWKAKRTREFIVQRIAQVEDSLRIAEDSLETFQEKNRTIALTEQTQASILAASETLGRIYALELENSLLQRFARSNHPQVQALEAQIAELRAQLDRLDRGNNGRLGQDQSTIERAPAGGAEILPPLERIPGLATELYHRMQEVQVLGTMLKLLRSRLEDARIEEVRDTPTLEILDTAFPPTYRARPQRKIYTLLALFTALVLGALVAVGYGAWHRKLSDEKESDLHYLVSELTRDIEKIKHFGK